MSDHTPLVSLFGQSQYPPNSQAVNSETTLSDTTPLRRDISGSATHASSTIKKASERYANMTFDLFERFVRPMPIDLFLEQFVPEAPTARPQGGFAFSKDSVSQNKKEFARPGLFKGWQRDIGRPRRRSVIDSNRYESCLRDTLPFHY